MERGLVSVITPCYNGGRFIRETIESVLAQTYSRWEMLIIDDGSTDRSAEIIRSFAAADERIRYYYQENAGSAAARTNGIRRARGQYIALLDADDIWRPAFLEKQIAFMRAKQALCVACAYDHIDAASRPVMHTTPVMPVITPRDMRVMDRIGCLTGLYDCTRYGKVYLPEKYRSLKDDYAYWYHIVTLAGRAYGNPEPLAVYRVRTGGATDKKYKMIPVQYRFYRLFFRQSPPEAAWHVIRWGLAGLWKFRP